MKVLMKFTSHSNSIASNTYIIKHLCIELMYVQDRLQELSHKLNFFFYKMKIIDFILL